MLSPSMRIKLSITCMHLFHFVEYPLCWLHTSFRSEAAKCSDSAVRSISKFLKECRTLDFSKCKNITQESFSILLHSGATKIRCLNLKGANGGSTHMLQYLHNCTDLTDLIIDDRSFRDSQFAQSIPHVTSLISTANPKLMNELVSVGMHLTSLRELDITGCYRIKKEALCEFALELVSTQLTELNLRGVPKVNDEFLSLLAPKCSNLRKLNLELCNMVSDKGIDSISDNCHNIEIFQCNQIRSISDAGVWIRAVQSWPRLAYLDLADCLKVDNSVLQAIGSACKELIYLNIRACEHVIFLDFTMRKSDSEDIVIFLYSVTDEGVAHISGCSKLELLDLTNCRRIVRINSILAECRNLKTIALADCSDFDWNAFMTAVSLYNPPLIKLDLASTTLNDDALALLADAQIPSLTNISIHGCQSITDRSFVGPESSIRLILDTRQARYPSDGHKFFLMMCDCRKVSIEALRELREDYASGADSEFQSCLHLRCVKDLVGAKGRICSCSTRVDDTSVESLEESTNK